METRLQIFDAEGCIAMFTGAAGRGVFTCRDILPLSVAWHLGGTRFDEVVTIHDPAGQWLKSAAIISVDTNATGTTFQLSLPSGRH